jgi:hypothetical protein
MLKSRVCDFRVYWLFIERLLDRACLAVERRRVRVRDRWFSDDE